MLLTSQYCLWSDFDFPWRRVCLCVSSFPLWIPDKIWYESMLTFYIPPYKAAALVHINKHLTAESHYVDVSRWLMYCFCFSTELGDILHLKGFIVLCAAPIDHHHVIKWEYVPAGRGSGGGCFFIFLRPHSLRPV